MDIIATLAREFQLQPWQVKNTVQLIDDGNTIPFIARYRKEMTGSLNDQVLRELEGRLRYLRHLEEEREKVRAAIEEQGALTEELAQALDKAATLTEIEDLYRPFRPKRKTRASVAKAKGLQPLADTLYAQATDCPDPLALAAEYINPELGVATAEEALQGAQDIIAEMVSDHAEGRRRLRSLCMASGFLTARANAEDVGVYETYADYTEPVSKVPSHRVLAVNRGEREKLLKVSIELDRVKALDILRAFHIKPGSAATPVVEAAVEDAYDRLIFPAVEREIRNQLTDAASEAAIRVFSMNLRQLLMQPPVKGMVTIGLDPGYRTGCKAAVVDQNGKVLDTGVIYPVPPHNKIDEAKALLKRWVDAYGVRVFAIGNGTASRETEMFVAELIRELPDRHLAYMVVSEAGASVYSASRLAAEEFPEFDVSLRSAVSIARRLQDPLAELVKIDPKSIGVGQYQHDMPPARLSEALDGVVEDCVNTVGVDVNTASVPLLTRVAGISSAVAKNIVAFREQNGGFTSREELKQVPRLGPKVFEQAAGFLRVPESPNLLDNTAVHPESYAAAEQLLAICGCAPAELPDRVAQIGADKLAEQLGIGVPTLMDIVSELQRPGRDPREELPPPLLRTDVMGIEDLKPGMELTGTVRNVIDFGAFVDIGVGQDGLVHISQLSDRFVRHPSEVVKVGDIVKVWVLSVDIQKQRISLTMRRP